MGVELTANLPPEEPQVDHGPPGTALLREAHRLRSAYEDYRHHLSTASFTGTDEAKTVTATVSGSLRLTGLRIQKRLLTTVGYEAVGQRITDAVRSANAAAAASVGPQQEKLLGTLGLTADVMQQFDSAFDKP
jgi:DNA-binding protein YbaB